VKFETKDEGQSSRSGVGKFTGVKQLSSAMDAHTRRDGIRPEIETVNK